MGKVYNCSVKNKRGSWVGEREINAPKIWGSEKMNLKLGNNEFLLMVVFKIMCLFCAGCVRMSNMGGKNAGKRIPKKISVD